jgi:hypothetical protein
MKIHPVGAELLHAEGRTERQRDRHYETIVALRNFANVPNKSNSYLKIVLSPMSDSRLASQTT